MVCVNDHYRVARRPDVPRTIGWVAPPTFNGLFKQFAKLVHPDMFGGAEEQQKVNQESLQRLNAFVSTLKSREGGISYPPKQQLNLVFYLKKRHNDAAYLPYIVAQGRHLLDRSSFRFRREQAAPEPQQRGMKMIRRWRAQQQQNHQEATGVVREPPAPERGEIIESEYYILPVRLTTNGTMCKNLIAKQFRSMFLRAGVEGAASEFTWDADYWKYIPRDPNAPVKKDEPKKEED